MSNSAEEKIRNACGAYLLLIKGENVNLSWHFSERYTVHLTEKSIDGGHDLIRSAAKRLKNAFSELSLDVEILVQDTDTVVWRRVFRGIQSGSYYGFPGTGNEIIWQDMVTSRLVGDVIAEEWIVSDLAERLLLSRKQKTRTR